MPYPESYNSWAGNPRGTKPDRTRCCESVADGGRSVMVHQCRNKVWKDDYCKTHHPDTVAKRNDANRQRYLKRNRDEFMRFGVKALVDALLEIEAGHNDPRSLAKEKLDVLRAKEWWEEPS